MTILSKEVKMGYTPREGSKAILDRAWLWVQSVEYSVTVRWVFYRLLQDSVYSTKSGYKHLLGLLSKARKEFYGEWRPWSLADDSRAPILMEREGYYSLYMRGASFPDEKTWLVTLRQELNCPLDRWATQEVYAEIWFEAGAMQGQFLHYANENVPLLAFHGDISIPEKWRAARRIADAWERYHHPIEIFYYGDYDPKGMIIPDSAWRDIKLWAYSIIAQKGREAAKEFYEHLNFTRVGINETQLEEMALPENPERPGTYQWEALSDQQAADLISHAGDRLSDFHFKTIKSREAEIVARFRARIKD